MYVILRHLTGDVVVVADIVALIQLLLTLLNSGRICELFHHEAVFLDYSGTI
jgi:hypothetical protein